jgi:hypothetical protein
MSNVIPFPNPAAPIYLEGAEREAALQCYREAAATIAREAVGKAFGFLASVPGCRGLGCEEVLPLFVEAFGREIAKASM